MLNDLTRSLAKWLVSLSLLAIPACSARRHASTLSTPSTLSTSAAPVARTVTLAFDLAPTPFTNLLRCGLDASPDLRSWSTAWSGPYIPGTRIVTLSNRPTTEFYRAFYSWRTP